MRSDDAIFRAENLLRGFIGRHDKLPAYQRRELAEIMEEIKKAQIDLDDAREDAAKVVGR